MKQMTFFAAACCIAATFVACELQQTQGQNYFIRTSDNTMGTVEICVDGGDCTYDEGYGCGGSYADGTNLIIRAIANEGFRFVKWDDENTDNPRTITVTCDNNFYLNPYTAIFDYIVTGTENGHEYVDLGLPSGLKWATCNVGATIPQDFGKHYAWGETTPNGSYDWETYKWCNGDSQIKYCTNRDYGTVDNKTILDPEDDAAHVNWGGAWRMPTAAEWTELHDNCTWIYLYDEYDITKNVFYRVIGPNGNIIVLPCAGLRIHFSWNNIDGGYYWSSSLNTDYPSYAWGVYFSSDDVRRNDDSRCYGYSVRPVCE